MASGPDTCSICTPARLLVDPAAPSLAALHSTGMLRLRGAEQLLGNLGAGKRKGPGLGKTRSLTPQLYQSTVGKAETSQAGT